MTSSFFLQNYSSLPCFILYSKDKFACFSRYFLTSYFCIPVPYNEKGIFFEYQFQKVLQVFIEPFNFSFFSVTGWGIDLDYRDIECYYLDDLKIRLFWSIQWVNVITRVLKYGSGDRREPEGDMPTEQSQRCNPAGFEGEGRGEPRNIGKKLPRETDSPLELPEKNSVLFTL